MKKEIQVPAGEYYFGDPCYAVPVKLWMDLLKSSDYFSEISGTVKGCVVYAVNTKYGDYSDTLGREFPVDAGLIGLTPVSLVEPNKKVFGSHLIKLSEPTYFGRDDSGKIWLGDVSIETGDIDIDDDFLY